MSMEAERRPPLMRFLDAFLQEGNIKWILGLGMLILFGSSLMLVTTHWASYTPLWKYAILLAYTAGVHGTGQLAYHRLALRKTGTGLMALTVLLMPLTFLAVRWVQPDGMLTLAGLMKHAGLLSLLGVNAVFSWFASRRIFKHFLRRTQPTFLASFLTLCVAGAVLPLIPAAFVPIAALVLWGVFTIGTVKVNRHVFWLTEEHRLPRIYGFFPILLLGGHFLTLFLLMLAPTMHWAWIGFGIVLVAVPILLASDAWARVHEARNDECSRPLPWHIAMPMFVGVMAAVGGVALSTVGYPATVTLVPTAALAAVVMFLTARRTRHAGFVWMTLLFTMMAYQTSPVFFKEIARSAVQHGASAVHEPRLPYAFYGLTYLPFLALTTVLAAWQRRRGDTLFAPTLRHISIGLGGLLLAVSVTHAKALLPVGLVMAGLFAVQMVLFCNRRLLGFAIVASLFATAGVSTFVTGVLQWTAVNDLPLIAWTIAGALLLIPGALIDRWSLRFASGTSRWDTLPLCQLTSLIVAIGTAACWLGSLAFAPSMPLLSGGIITAILLVHAVRWRRDRTSDILGTAKLNLIGEGALSFAAFYPLYIAAQHGWEQGVVNLLAGILAGYWMLSLVLARKPQTVLAQAFARPAAHIGRWGSILLMGVFLVPFLTLCTLFGHSLGPWIAVVITLAVLCHSTWHRQSLVQTIFCWIATLMCSAAAMIQLTGIESLIEWVPTLWAGMSLLAIAIVRGVSTLEDREPSHVLKAVDWCIVGTTVLISVASLPWFTLSMRVAGGIALVALWWLSRMRSDVTSRTALLMVFNWQVLSGLCQWICPAAHSVFDLTPRLLAESGLLLAAAASLMTAMWAKGDRARTHTDLAHVQLTALGLVTGICILSTGLLWGEPLSLLQILMAISVFAIHAAMQIREAIWKWAESNDTELSTRDAAACREVAELRVWLAEAIVAAGIGYLVLFGVITLGAGWSLYLTLAAGVAAWAIGTWAGQTTRFTVLHKPLLTTGLWLPAVTVGLGVYRHIAYTQTLWLGANSLALLLAGGFYFWRGLETRRPGLLLGSAGILNVALALLWRELHWTDPQLFLIPLGVTMIAFVELLKRELPAKMHDPLRYAGALMILVSPAFHILGGSWLHMIVLMVASVAVALVAMGLRVKALMYTGSAFLVADIIAMVVRGTIDNPNLLWITGIGVGAAVISLAAYCERHREDMLQQLRVIAAKLEAWE
ncbi:MAG: hypothetical protein KDA93_15715 [Planctomycetaceae bacterium]|nr:hypothetical protein [Planctomycetaceae bacterium]